mgnify:CR=1 FL=1
MQPLVVHLIRKCICYLLQTDIKFNPHCRHAFFQELYCYILSEFSAYISIQSPCTAVKTVCTCLYFNCVFLFVASVGDKLYLNIGYCYPFHRSCTSKSVHSEDSNLLSDLSDLLLNTFKAVAT